MPGASYYAFTDYAQNLLPCQPLLNGSNIEVNPSLSWLSFDFCNPAQ
jgi:hypothetical protein